MVQARRPSEALAEAVAELETMSKDELRQRWKANIKAAPPPRASREFLERSLAYRIQEQALGGLPPRVQKQLDRLTREFERDPGFTPAPTPTFKPGTRLVREWKGAVHEIEILERGYSWRGVRYGSLSKVAREITGTRWSGPAFFGLKKPQRKDMSHGR